MNQYKIKSILNLTSTDLKAIKQDSLRHEGYLDCLLNLNSNYITSIDAIRLYSNQKAVYIGTTTTEEIDLYLKLKVWQTDILENLNTNHCMATYDFIEAHRYPFFDRVCQDKVYLYIDNHFDKYKDIFVFGVPSKVYWRTSNYERIRIYDRARVIMEHMYRNIRFGNILDFSEAESETKLTLESLKHRSSNYQHILDEFDLSQSSFEYLKYVSMGCITKQVASMLDTSVRTVEGRINSLCRKLDVLNKYELESAAKIITDKLIYTKTLCNGFLAA